MLVVNSELDKQGEGLRPNLPFTLSHAPLSAVTSGMPGTTGMLATGVSSDALLVLELLVLSLALVTVGTIVRRYS